MHIDRLLKPGRNWFTYIDSAAAAASAPILLSSLLRAITYPTRESTTHLGFLYTYPTATLHTQTVPTKLLLLLYPSILYRIRYIAVYLVYPLWMVIQLFFPRWLSSVRYTLDVTKHVRRWRPGSVIVKK